MAQRRPNTAQVDAFLDFGFGAPQSGSANSSAWNADFVRAIPEAALDAATLDDELRADPSLRPQPLSGAGRDMLAMIAQNGGWRGLARAQPTRSTTAQPPARRRDPLANYFLPHRGRDDDDDDNNNNDDDSGGAASTQRGTDNDGDSGNDDDNTGNGGSGVYNDDDNGDDDTTVYTFEHHSVGRDHDVAAGAFGGVEIAWREMPAPAAAAATPYVLLDAAQRAAVERAPPGSQLDELAATLSTLAPDTRTTAARLCSELACAGAAYVRSGHTHTHDSDFYLFSIPAALHLVVYVRPAAPTDPATTTTTTTKPTTTTTTPTTTTTTTAQTASAAATDAVLFIVLGFFMLPPSAKQAVLDAAPGAEDAAVLGTPSVASAGLDGRKRRR